MYITKIYAMHFYGVKTSRLSATLKNENEAGGKN